MTGDWWRMGEHEAAWFEAPSLTTAASTATAIIAVAPEAHLEVRDQGLRVRLTARSDAAAVARIVATAGLVAQPAGLQRVRLVLASDDPTVADFWGGVLSYAAGEGDLTDPLHRDPDVHLIPRADTGSARNRIHVDVVRPAAVVAEVTPGEGGPPYGLCHADADGNDLDLVPGDSLGEDETTADWDVVFAAMACYLVSSVQQRALVEAAAALAQDAGFPLLIDAPPGRVILDSGKDMADPDAHGLDVDFAPLAAALQAAARRIGARPATGAARLVQVVYAVSDIPAARRFWSAALGYGADRREGVTDLVDPRRCGPVLVFQYLDADAERRAQRDRLHLELEIPDAVAADRVAAALASGGRVIGQEPGRWRLADPDGNEVVFLACDPVS